MSPRKTHHSSLVACIHSTIKAEYTKAKTVLDSTKIAPVLPVGSQNQIRREVQRYKTFDCCRIPALRGFGQAVPSVSFWIRDRGTARHTLFEATFWVVGSAILSARRILGSSHRSPVRRVLFQRVVNAVLVVVAQIIKKLPT